MEKEVEQPAPEIPPRELNEARQRGWRFQLLDVREPEEFAIANLGGISIPLGELTQRYHELDPAQPTVVLCHHGVRSRRAIGFLRTVGFEKLHNLTGGIDRWSLTVDATVRRY